MNQSNVDALTKLILAVDTATDPPYQMFTNLTARLLAAGLAERGVLVPSSLTENDVMALTSLNWKDIDLQLPAALEKIARGEP